MVKNTTPAALDAILEDFNFNDDAAISKKMVGLWLPEDYKIKYDDIQRKTKRAFGKKMQELVMQSIDKIDQKMKAG